MGPRRSGSSTNSRRRWHARIEQYTPDGALGRWLLGAPLGMTGLWLLALSVFEVPRWGLTLEALFWGPALVGAGLPTFLLAVLVLWPVYLSLIGNISSPAAYSVADTAASASKPAVNSSGPVATGDDAGERTAAKRTAADSTRRTATPSSPPDVNSPPSTPDPVEDLKRRYAAGDLGEEEFERRIEAHFQDDSRDRNAETNDELSARESERLGEHD
ncbi:SHOCT domain-containing protein [Natrialba sp. PRR66]|uniref:SHOCT domain-containing protein n=1 Tax=Natrialba sp. PRR66 TaxID=3098146 RepID=UPI002B1D7154|nr:SHOCT domain-containing protein [Natrialba sp. PRR66]